MSELRRALEKLDRNNGLETDNEGSFIYRDEVLAVVDSFSHPEPPREGLREKLDKELSIISDKRIRGPLRDRILALIPAEAPGLTAAALLAWFKSRPGVSWIATIKDIEAAISTMDVPAPAPREEPLREA